MKSLILIFLFFIGTNALGQDFSDYNENTSYDPFASSNSRNWNLYLTHGTVHLYNGLETVQEQESLMGVGLLYGIHNSVGIGAYIQSNEHFGAMIRTHILSWLKLRLMVGQTKETSYNETLTPDPEDRFQNTLSFGLGLDIPLFWRLGLTVQGFSSASGNGGYNNEISYGLSVSF